MKEIAIITGASSGIGFEMVKLFSWYKKDVLIVARDEQKLLSIKNLIEEQYKTNV
jgi:short-subunit dehydrogenase